MTKKSNLIKLKVVHDKIIAKVLEKQELLTKVIKDMYCKEEGCNNYQGYTSDYCALHLAERKDKKGK